MMESIVKLLIDYVLTQVDSLSLVHWIQILVAFSLFNELLIYLIRLQGLAVLIDHEVKGWDHKCH
jgi:hypothetical protein